MTGASRVLFGSNSRASFLLRYFEDFYCEVVRFKQAIETHNIAKEESPDKPPSAPQETIVDNIQNSLLKLLNTQALDTSRFGGDYGIEEYREAEFVMVALADEIFVHMDWDGKNNWKNNIIESQLYQTHKSGEAFFEKIEKFLKQRDPSRVDMAMIYLLALGLGFLGRYRGTKDQSAIKKYKEDLYKFIYKKDPTLFDDSTLAFKQAYDHTLDAGKPVYLNEFRPWVIVFSAACVLMLIISYGIWRVETNELYRDSNDIIEMSMNAP